jgi:hypothetical protein
VKICAIRHDAGQDRYVATSRSIKGLQPIAGQQFGGPHKS